MITEAKRAYNRAYYASRQEELKTAQKVWYRNNRDVVKVKNAERYNQNREIILLQKRDYTQRTKAQRKIYNRGYNVKNAVAQKARAKRYRAANREKINASNRAYWKKHPDKFKAWKQNWTSKNRGKVNAYDAKRNAQELAATIDPVAAQWFYEIVHNQDSLTCAYCSKTITPKHAHVDHIIPVSRGGEHGPNNFCVACSTCNQSKSDDMLHEWKKLPERVKPLLEFI